MKKNLFLMLIFFVTVSCEDQSLSLMGNDKSQVQIRSYQSRSFDTGDKDFVMRGVISTMQDLGFIIEKADDKFGVVSGTSFSSRSRSKMTVSIRTVNSSTTVVRVNAQAGVSEIESPTAYSNFFNSLSQALFLEANLTE